MILIYWHLVFLLCAECYPYAVPVLPHMDFNKCIVCVRHIVFTIDTQYSTPPSACYPSVMNCATFVPRTHTRTRTSVCLFTEAILYGHWSSRGVRFVRCPEVRGCPYLGGRSVLNVCYDGLGAGSLSVLCRLSASLRVDCRTFHCIVFPYMVVPCGLHL